MDIVHPEVDAYMSALASVDDEPGAPRDGGASRGERLPDHRHGCAAGCSRSFARAVGAKRIFEMGSGFGYSAYWFSRATGPDGEIHLTDTDPENEKKALDFLRTGGSRWARSSYHVEDAFEAFDAHRR